MSDKMTMKAISIREPWASLILEGKKTVETRKWWTHYRGTILLCASKTPASPIAGYAFATARIVDCEPMVKQDEPAACCPYYDGAFSWYLGNVTPLKERFPVKGQLGLFNVEVTIDGLS